MTDGEGNYKLIDFGGVTKEGERLKVYVLNHLYPEIHFIENMPAIISGNMFSLGMVFM